MKRFSKRCIALLCSAMMIVGCLTPIPGHAAEGDTPIQIIAGRTQAYGKDIAFDSTKTWNDKGEHQVALTTTKPLNAGAYVTMDIVLPVGANYEGSIKIQGAARLGSGWTWTEATSIPELSITNFDTEADDFKTASIRFDFNEKVEANNMVTFTLKFAGCKCDYAGPIFIENVNLYNGPGDPDQPDEPDEPTTDVVYSQPERVQLLGKDVALDDTKTWHEVGTEEIAVSGAVTLNEGAYMTADILIPTENVFEGILKIQGAAKVGSGWTWVNANIVDMYSTGFVTAEDGMSKMTIKFTHGAKAIDTELMVVCLKIAGYKCDYAGPIYMENLTVYNVVEAGTEEPVDPDLPIADDAVIDNFDTGANGWEAMAQEDNWQHSKEAVVSVAQFNSSNMLKVDLDYSLDASYNWSEAKIQKLFDTAYDVSAYNCITMDYYYPAEFAGSALKFFGETGILDTEADIETVETLENGYVHAEVTVKFKESENDFTKLIIGFVGKSTSFVGSVYVDNMTLSQYNAAGEYVKITSTVEEQTAVDVTGAPTTVQLVDADATAQTKALYAYLSALASNDQVLFGHQNDYNKSVSSSATEGDVKEITGSLSGIYGIDTLSLTGAELGITDADKALKTSIENSLAAANQGAIVTLSTHMPNFTNGKITKNSDGTYDFTSCDFAESKDLSGNCADQILPGGAYNAQFTAYLDIIADYAKGLDAEGVPVLFRPFHENSGGWFWWGSGTSVETYKSMFRYMVDYLQSEGVHNLLYVYSPNGPVTSEAKYVERYPGDAYVDILAFDYYDDYNTYPATPSDSFFTNLDKSCEVLGEIAESHGKLAAISETGARVMKKDGSDNEGILVSGNPITKEASGTNWYQKISDIAAANNMPYYLVWANFGDTNFYVPYKHSDTLGHELINDFIDYYNNEKSIFADGTNFYGNLDLENITGESDADVRGYMIAPFDKAVITDAATLRASVANATLVTFVISNGDETLTLEATAVEGTNEYQAQITADQLAALGKTDTATIQLIADGETLATLTNISLGQEKATAPADIIEDFEYYLGDNNMLNSAYSENSDANASSSFVLSADKIDGTYGGAFTYTLKTTGSETWTGRVKTLEHTDFSDYNAITMWVKPDGKGQKVVVQINSNGEDFEVFLTQFVKGTEAQYVTIPFTSFVGKASGTLDTANITKFGVYCNSIIPEGHDGEWVVQSNLGFDGIRAAKLDGDILDNIDEQGLIITDKSPLDTSSSSGSTTSWYTVRFDTCGGSTINGVSVRRNGTVSKPSNPTRDGYVFAGWFTDAAYTGVYNFNAKVTGRITLYAKWTATSGEWVNPFTDVAERDWFYDTVEYASQNQLFSGISATRFAPNAAMTRGMLVTVLYQAAGAPDAQASKFTDVSPTSYYAKAVAWASEKGIVTGSSETTFAPDDYVTREQVAVILKGYGEIIDLAAVTADDLSQFADVAAISDWARDSVQWAVGAGLMCGKDNENLAPTSNGTRAEVATMLQRFFELAE